MRGAAQQDLPDSLRIYVNGRHAGTVAFGRLDSLWAHLPYSWAVLDSVHRREGRWHMYYSAPGSRSEIRFLTDRPVPPNVRKYYRRRLRRSGGRLTPAVRASLVSDFIHVTDIRPVRHDTIYIIYIKGRYHPPGRAEAVLGLMGEGKNVRLDGIARLDVHNLLSGNDALSFRYDGAPAYRRLDASYAWKYPLGLPLSWHVRILQELRDTVAEGLWETYAEVPLGTWRIFLGRGRPFDPASPGHWLTGAAGRRKYGKFYELEGEVVLAAERTRLRRMAARVEGRRRARTDWRIRLLYHEETRLQAPFGKYAGPYNRELLLLPGLRRFGRVRIRGGKPYRNFGWYGFAEWNGAVYAEGAPRSCLITGAGWTLRMRGFTLALEGGFRLKENYQSENQKFMLSIRQFFQW
ncbi:MAG: hypothetical protein GXO27_05190 [Chlorobi bacterium]|nr:hypothetical protein [Chlorobiota bacterium]